MSIFFIVLLLTTTNSRLIEDVQHTARSRLEFHRARLGRQDDEYREILRARYASALAKPDETKVGQFGWEAVGEHGMEVAKKESKVREKRYKEEADSDFDERVERSKRDFVGERGERAERVERGERGMKSERGERGERAERQERGERIEVWERGIRGERRERWERAERLESVKRVSEGNPDILNPYAMMKEQAVEEARESAESAAARREYQEDVKKAQAYAIKDEKAQEKDDENEVALKGDDSGFSDPLDMPELYYTKKSSVSDEVAVGAVDEDDSLDHETLAELYQHLELYDPPGF